MTEFKISGRQFKEMVVSAAGYLELNKQLLNDLNVFPVPDGDTGTNMMMTMMSAAREVNAASDSDPLGKVVRAFSTGALKGARGNSGVILSQLFRGFSNAVPKDKEWMDAKDFCNAIEEGVKAAYNAVMKPKEGTILTVAKGMAEEAARQKESSSNIFSIIDAVIEKGEEVLQKTPEMLPVLKEAGVVDAGGAGLLVIYKGFKMSLDGEDCPAILDLSTPVRTTVAPVAKNDISTADIEFGYCTEFFITNLQPNVDQAAIDKLRSMLLNIGDSLVLVGDEEMIKIHVHTNVPGKALQYALRLGQLSKIKIDNMREQHESLEGGVAPVTVMKDVAIIAVAAGEGLGALLTECGADGLVSGGQSMNPSAEDIRLAVEAAPSNDVIVLPNNKNIILAAEQVSALTKKKIHVIPTRSFPQGISALLAYDAERDLEGNIAEMKEMISAVHSGSVTSAVRDSQIHGEAIHQGEIMGLLEDEIVVHCDDKKEVLSGLIAKMADEDSAVISLYYGEAVSEDEAMAMRDMIEEKYPDCDVDCLSGGQPIYDYLVSVE